MNLSEYNEIIDKIKEYVEVYDKTSAKNNNYFLSLANGDSINIRTPENRVAHLLGINIDYLRNSGKFRSNMSAYDILRDFLDDSFFFYKKCTSGEMKFDKIFSKNIHEKLDCFYTNTHINIANIEFIIKYDREKTYQSEPVAENTDYFIVRKSNDGAYYVLGIVNINNTNPENNSNIYVPTTSRKYTDEKSFNSFMERVANKQELTYAFSNYVSNNLNGYNNLSTLFFNNKISVLKGLINYSEKYNASTSVANDFLFVISKNKQTLENQQNIYDILSILHNRIKNRTPLDINTIDKMSDVLSPDVKNLIDTCNDMICSSDNSDNGSYSKISDENKKIREELQALRKQLEMYKKQNEELNSENERLSKNNQIYSDYFNKQEEEHQKTKSLLS